MHCDSQQWEAVLRNLEKFEAVNAGLDGLASNVKVLQSSLDEIEEVIGDTGELKGATIVGTLNMLVAMIEQLQNTVSEKEQQ